MNLDSLSFALSQISYSVANLTKKNYKASVAEISHVSTHIFICLYLVILDWHIFLVFNSQQVCLNNAGRSNAC